VSKPRLVEHPLWPAFEAMLRDEPSFSWLRTSAENFTLQLWQVFLAGANAERAACAEIANQHGDALWKEYKQGEGPLRADPWAEGGSDAAHHIATLIEDRGKQS
jgi:hypothetical protein